MKLKYYVVFAAIFMLIVGVYVYDLESASYTYHLPFSQMSITLPVALWVVLIVALFFVATLVVFASAWAKDLLENYHRKNDYNKLLSQINEQALNQDIKNRVFKRKAFGDLSKILQRFYLKPRLDSVESFNRKIDTLFENYTDVMSGKVVDLKSYHLSRDNKFNMQNIKNKIQANYEKGFKILEENYPDELKRFAATEIIKNAKLKEIESIAPLLNGDNVDKPIAQEIFKLYLKNTKDIKPANIYALMKKTNTSAMDYVRYAISSKGELAPDEWIRFFEGCADNDENAEMAFFYVLFELEMIDKAKERHRSHSKGEYKIIDAYLDLRSLGKHYPFDIFLLQPQV